MQVQTEIKTRNAAEIRCKLGLVLFLLLSFALIAAGLWGIDQYNESGFDQEAAYGYIHKLSGEVDSLYENGILPVMNGMDAGMKTAIEQRSRELLQDAWTSAAKEDRAAAVDTYLSAASDPAREQMELLSLTYSVAGPKVSSKEKKAMAAMTDAERADFRAQVLAGVADETSALPELAADAHQRECRQRTPDHR